MQRSHWRIDAGPTKGDCTSLGIMRTTNNIRARYYHTSELRHWEKGKRDRTYRCDLMPHQRDLIDPKLCTNVMRRRNATLYPARRRVTDLNLDMRACQRKMIISWGIHFNACYRWVGILSSSRYGVSLHVFMFHSNVISARLMMCPLLSGDLYIYK